MLHFENEYITMLNKILILSFLLFSTYSFTQVKPKYFGDYEGVIPTYKLDLGGDVVSVAESSIRVKINEKSIEQTIGNETKSGTWKLYFEGKTYYIINVSLDNQNSKERIVIYKKGDRLKREGIFPQPSADLKKKGD